MLVTVERAGPVAVVTLNRPEAMNALSRGLRAELAAAMVELDNDDAIRAVVLTGRGRGFGQLRETVGQQRIQVAHQQQRRTGSLGERAQRLGKGTAYSDFATGPTVL